MVSDINTEPKRYIQSSQPAPAHDLTEKLIDRVVQTMSEEMSLSICIEDQLIRESTAEGKYVETSIRRARLLVSYPRTTETLEPVPTKVIHEDSTIMALRQELDAFRRLLPALLRDAEGLYVAVRGGIVVDKDRKADELIERVGKRYPDNYVLVRKVVSVERPDAVMPSPQVVR